jgi:hypothetical protein
VRVNSISDKKSKFSFYKREPSKERNAHQGAVGIPGEDVGTARRKFGDRLSLATTH